MWDLIIHPFKFGVLVDVPHGVYDSDIICNCLSLLLVDIVRFNPLRIAITLIVLKCIYEGEIFVLLNSTKVLREEIFDKFNELVNLLER